MTNFVTDTVPHALTWGDAAMLDANYNRVIRTLSSFRVLRLNSVESGSCCDVNAPANVGAFPGLGRHDGGVDVPQRRTANAWQAPIRSTREEGTTFEEIIGARIMVDPSGCWLWTGPTDGAGYGVASVRGDLVRVHRFVYETLVDRCPEGYHVHHDCEVKVCCNPAHLRALSPSDHARHHGVLARSKN